VSAALPNRRLTVVDGFAREARALRAHFEQRFADPRKATADRFVWDLWNVPGQYTALRTPAWQFFPPKLYDAFHQRLVWWGRRTLGCHDVAPPWLSCYVNGCEQRLHGDLPHGQFAFVFSLTKWAQRTFRGGETLVARDGLLEFWRGFTSLRSLEEPDLLEAIEPRFNRLVVFDPRLPHAVRRVDGSMEMTEGRLVIHSWFVQPRPFIEGALKTSELARAIDSVSEVVSAALEGGLALAGLASFGFGVTAAGQVRAVKLLADTTRGAPGQEADVRRLLRRVQTAISGLKFGRQRGPSRVTLPLVFDR
jgi:hypothetical protein